jgi:hypothetical protein
MPNLIGQVGRLPCYCYWFNKYSLSRYDIRLDGERNGPIAIYPSEVEQFHPFPSRREVFGTDFADFHPTVIERIYNHAVYHAVMMLKVRT